MAEAGLFSIGYGSRPMEEFLGLLQDHAIAALVDVRGVPFSRFHPDYGRDALAATLRAQGLDYHWMGDTLGGRHTGKPAPSAQAFLSSLRRLALLGATKRVAYLCAELRPENCHRVRLLGAALHDAGIDVRHIDEHGFVLTHAQVVRRLTGGQVTLERLPAMP